jgi:hypothetical protein
MALSERLKGRSATNPSAPYVFSEPLMEIWLVSSVALYAKADFRYVGPNRGAYVALLL